VGIRLFVGAIEKVFHCQIKFLDDIASAVGSFFTMLEKAIDDVIEALSVLFHFEEILKTQKLIEGYLQSLLQQAGTVIAGTVLPAVDGFLTTAEDDVKNWFASLKADLGTDYQVSNLPASQSSAHTAMAAGKNGQNPQSYAVQGGWGIQKMKANMGAATVPSASLSANAASGDDPLADLFNAFLASIQSNPDLNQAWNQLGTDFNGLFQASSVGGFFKTLLNVFLDAIEALIEGGIAITKAVTDGLLTAFDDIIKGLFDPSTGLLTAEIDIPVLSWLYNALTGEKLSILSLISLVLAIPVTVMYRVIAGNYPSEDLPPPHAGLVEGENAAMQITPAQQRAIAFSAIIGIARIVQGLAKSWILFFQGCGLPFGKNPYVFRALVAANFVIVAFSLPVATSDINSVSSYAWTVWGVTAGLTLLSIQPMLPLGLSPAAQELMRIEMTVFNCGLSILQLAAAVVGYMKTSPSKQGIGNDLGFSSKVLVATPGIIGPLALVGGDVCWALSAFSLLDGFAICALIIAAACETPASPQPQGFLALPAHS